MKWVSRVFLFSFSLFLLSATKTNADCRDVLEDLVVARQAPLAIIAPNAMSYLERGEEVPFEVVLGVKRALREEHLLFDSREAFVSWAFAGKPHTAIDAEIRTIEFDFNGVNFHLYRETKDAKSSFRGESAFAQSVYGYGHLYFYVLMVKILGQKPVDQIMLDEGAFRGVFMVQANEGEPFVRVYPESRSFKVQEGLVRVRDGDYLAVSR